MMNLLAADGIIKYLEDNIVLTIILAVIIALIIALIVAMIVLSAKAKKQAATEETAPAETPAEEQPADEQPAEEAKEEPAPVEEKKEEPAPAPVEEKKEEPAPAPVEEKKEPAPAPVEEKKEPAPVAKKEEVKKAPAKKPAEKPVEKKEPAKKPVEKKEPAKRPAAEPVKVSAANGKWVIRKQSDGKFSFELVASNGEVMLTSAVPYASLSSAKSGIQTYKTNIADGKFSVVETKAGDFLFQLLNARGAILATGMTYKNRSRCESAVESTKRWGASETIEVIKED